MKVGELRELLKSNPDDMEVVIQVDDDGGCEDIQSVVQSSIGDNGNGGTDYIRLEALPHRGAVILIPQS